MELTTKFFSEQIGGIKGICHAGSHSGREVSEYMEAGVETVVWIEANYKVMNRLIKNTAPYGKNQVWYCQCLWDQDDVVKVFNISNNEESSSVLEFGDGLKLIHPHLHYVDNTILMTKRMDTIVKSQTDFKWSEINMVVTDCQGADLEVLKGFGDLLSAPNIKLIKSEVELNEQYKNGSSHEKINEYLSKLGFEFRWYFHTADGWGDHYWVRK
jgi:FkbM family methyltransferase